MNSRKALAVGALWMALTVALGAFGAHGLEERLTASGHVATWETGVRYQAWSASGLVALGLLTARPDLAGAGRVTGWLLLVGSLLFSGSLYGLSLAPSARWLGPVTPLGGVLMILAWVGFAKTALALPKHHA